MGRLLPLCAASWLLAGCATTPTAGGTGANSTVRGPSGFPSAQAATSLAASRAYPDDGVTLDVPLAADVAKASAAQAYATCADDAVCYKGAPPTIEISNVTLASSIGTAVGTNKTNLPTLKGQLAYVLTWKNEPCRAAGPAGGSATTTSCTLVSLVNASTGKFVYGFEDQTGP
jgi:hypothetical protein